MKDSHGYLYVCIAIIACLFLLRGGAEPRGLPPPGWREQQKAKKLALMTRKERFGLDNDGDDDVIRGSLEVVYDAETQQYRWYSGGKEVDPANPFRDTMRRRLL
eukprot:GHVQ01001681.1.p1 GENE.GHVQ01001681.1~~GHVQ01001681.1.p1  ORF type:complete len:104 (-),score=18.30 GHVQ01001681.1:1813-2124(-)